jgi:hypothetical protein
MSRRWQINTSHKYTHFGGSIKLSSDDDMVPEGFNGKKAQGYELPSRRAKVNQVLPSELGTSLFVQIDSSYYSGFYSSWNAPAPSAAAIAARPCVHCGKTRADHHNNVGSHVEINNCYVRDVSGMLVLVLCSPFLTFSLLMCD